MDFTLSIGAIFFSLLGAIVGSFLNVVIFRYNTGKGICGRSGCLSCGLKLKAIDLIPILSFLCLGGRCRGCRTHLSFQYPLIEIFTAIVFLFVFLKGFSLALTLYHFLVFGILIVILGYDMRHKIIPDGLAVAFIILAILKTFYVVSVGNLGGVVLILELCSGLIIALPFVLLWFFSGGRWMGLGDGKLALGIGWYMGLSAGVSSIILGFWIGAVVSLILLGLSHLSHFKLPNLTMKSEIPFAPFLIIGMAVVFFFDIKVIDLSLFLSLL